MNQSVLDTHVKILGVLYVVLSSLFLLGALVVLLVFGGVAHFLVMFGGFPLVPLIATFGSAFMIFLIFIGSLGIVAGIGLYQRREWARILGIIVSAVNLIHPPVGTALGAYGLWCLLSPDGASLFRTPPP